MHEGTDGSGLTPPGDALRPGIRYAPEDPEVLALCLKWGFGAVMGSASRLWKAQDPVGALTVGPAAFEARNFALHGRPPLTAKQERLFGFIVGHIERTRRSPTQSEMADFMGKVRNSIHYMLKNMERKGWIISPKGRYSAVTPVLASEASPASPARNEPEQSSPGNIQVTAGEERKIG